MLVRVAIVEMPKFAPMGRALPPCVGHEPQAGNEQERAITLAWCTASSRRPQAAYADLSHHHVSFSRIQDGQSFQAVSTRASSRGDTE
jgi:hypothetical protein